MPTRRLLLICTLLLPLWTLTAQAPIPPPVTSSLKIQFTPPNGWSVLHLPDASFVIAASDPAMLTAARDLPPNADTAVRVLIFGTDQIALFGATPDAVLTAYDAVLYASDRTTPYPITLPDGRAAQRLDYTSDLGAGFALSFIMPNTAIGLIVAQARTESALITHEQAVYQLSASVRSIDCSGTGWIQYRACIIP